MIIDALKSIALGAILLAVLVLLTFTNVVIPLIFVLVVLIIAYGLGATIRSIWEE